MKDILFILALSAVVTLAGILKSDNNLLQTKKLNQTHYFMTAN